MFLTEADVAAGLRHVAACVVDEEPNHLAELGEPLAECELAWILFVTRNASVPRTLLDRVGTFDESFRGWGYEDTDLGYRLQRAGGHYVFCDSTVNYHQLHRSQSDWREAFGELQRNYRLLIDKHPHYSVLMHWRWLTDAITIERYLALVRDFARLSAAGPSAVLDDYLSACRRFAEAYCELPDARLEAIRRTSLGRFIVG